MNIGLELLGLPSRPTLEMYRMEHARQYKRTYLRASQKVGSRSVMLEENKEFEEQI